MQCSHFDIGECRSCALLPVPVADQVAGKQARTAELLPGVSWLPPVTGPESGFRNKAKMVVAGSVTRPTLGILDPRGAGVDLRDCGLHTPGLRAALPVLAGFVETAALTPYDVPARSGELKHLLVTESPDGELMVRFVLRSREAEARIRKHLPTLLDALPIAVASLNLQPDHKAVLEGETEIVLTERETLPMRVNDLVLQLRPQSFFQTNTLVAERLYATARAWAAESAARTVWDLYCGVGGFARHLAGPDRDVVGVEISAEAARAANLDAAPGLRFEAGDAITWATSQPAPPDLVVVNPPRRGLGPELAGWLERSGVREVLYSSCHVESLARDLAAMPSLRPGRGVLLDMFPQTTHHETLLHLIRED